MIRRILGLASNKAAAPVTATSVTPASAPAITRSSGVVPRVRMQGDMAFMNRRVTAPIEALDPRMKMPATASLGPSQNARYSRAVVGLARHAYRNNGHMRRGMRMVVSNIIGTGPLPCSRFSELQEIIRAWLPSADSRGRLSWGHFNRTLLLMDRIDGEGFVRLRPRRLSDGHVLPLQLELIETEQVAYDWSHPGDNGNPIITGIEIDALRRPVAYWMYPEHPLDGLMQAVTGNVGAPAPVPATSVLHVFSSVRGNSWRGDSSLLPALVRLYNLSSYDLNEATRKNVSTMFVGTLTRQPGEEGTRLPGEEETEYNKALTELALEPGIVAELPAGTELKWNTPPDTGTSYEPYVRFALMYLAACCDASYEDFTGDWRGASDRTWRAAQVSMRAFADEERDRLERQFLNPLYKVLVDLAIATGQWSPPPGVKPWEIYQTRWSWPGAKNPNQYQEYNAILLAVQAGLKSRDAAVEEMGEDPAEVDRRNAEGLERAKGYGLNYSSYVPPALGGGAPGGATATVGSMFEGLIQGIVRAQVEEGLRQRLADVGGVEEPPPPQPEPDDGSGEPAPPEADDKPKGDKPPKPARKPPAKKPDDAGK
ncbi:phage portal protein [uncultured Methylobacterium sp.]|uniref:phage portal protein n=1 Tax=uncultured Methylobacterium sp. TaxID=157278 RepID=UPI0035CB8005